jgi:hypothetical protein
VLPVELGEEDVGLCQGGLHQRALQQRLCLLKLLLLCTLSIISRISLHIVITWRPAAFQNRRYLILRLRRTSLSP